MATRGQKKIDTWQITQDGRTVAVEVFMHRATVATESDRGSTAKFIAKCDELKLRAENPNIDALQTDITEKIRAELTVDYSPFFVIEIKGISRGDVPGSVHFSANCEAKFNVDRIHLSADKTRFKRGGESSSSAFSKQIGNFIRDGRPHHYEPDVRALLPDTPETRAGLGRIVEGFRDLNKILREVCNVDRIETNLAVIGAPGGNLLTAGSMTETERQVAEFVAAADEGGDVEF